MSIYDKLTRLSDRLEHTDVPAHEVQRIIDEVRIDIMDSHDDVGASEHDWAGWAALLCIAIALVAVVAVIGYFA